MPAENAGHRFGLFQPKAFQPQPERLCPFAQFGLNCGGFQMCIRDRVVFDSRYARQDGRVMAPWRAALDTGGGRDKPYEDTRTMQAYEWLLRQRPGVVFGTKGMSLSLIHI